MSHTTKHPYTRTKAIDPSCRSHGDCPHCQGNRQHKHKRRMVQGDGLDWLLEGEEEEGELAELVEENVIKRVVRW